MPRLHDMTEEERDTEEIGQNKTAKGISGNNQATGVYSYEECVMRRFK
jgi:hypothetical protein